MKKRDVFILISMLALLSFAALFTLRSFDDNRLTNWQWVFDNVEAWKLYLILFAAIIISYYLSKIPVSKQRYGIVLFLFSFAASSVFWRAPEVIVDASRYFTYAKHVEIYGVKYFINEWGGAINPWTDMPFVPLLYGLIFKFFGESRLYIQIFISLLFAMTTVLTYLTGKILWDEETGFFGGLLILGIPYIFSQVPLMLVDIPAMFFLTLSIFAFVMALKKGGGWMPFSAFAISMTFFSKYSAWLMLSVLFVIFAVYLMQAKSTLTDNSGKTSAISIYRTFIVVCFSALFIGIVFWYKFDAFSDQIRLLISYQKPGLKTWGESYVSTFLFQFHPFISLAAIYSAYAAFRKKDLKYLIIFWLVFLVFVLQIKRSRYIIMIFPMVALMASYGLMQIKDSQYRKFIAYCIVLSSLSIALFAYLPFLEKISDINLKNAGRFLNSLNIEKTEVFALTEPGSPVNSAVAVPILDLFTRKNIIYDYQPDYFPEPDEIAKSSLRFTWEYKNPGYYSSGNKDPGDADAIVIISGSNDFYIPDHIEAKLEKYQNLKIFDVSEGIFQNSSIVTVYYN